VIDNRLILDGGTITGVLVNNAAAVRELATLVLERLVLLALGPASGHRR